FFILLSVLLFLYELFIIGYISFIGFFNNLLGALGYVAALLWIKFPQKRQVRVVITTFTLVLVTLAWANFERILYFNWNITFRLDRHEFISPAQYRLTDKDGAPFIFKKDQVYVIDFWYSGCSICFQKFPDFNRRYLHNNNERISYIAVNRPVKSDTAGQ